MERIREAFRLFCRGERAEGLGRLEALWEETEGGNPYYRCVTAHFLADTQDDIAAALEWDLRALEIAESATGPRDGGSPEMEPLRVFFPSLYLNVADGYRKAGDFDKARHHIERAIELSDVLRLDAYGQTVRAGLARVDAQIAEGDSGPPVTFDFD